LANGGWAAPACLLDSAEVRPTAAAMLPTFKNRRQPSVWLTGLSRSIGGKRQVEELVRETVRRRSALAITETLLKLIAAAAIIGLSRMPKMG